MTQHTRCLGSAAWPVVQQAGNRTQSKQLVYRTEGKGLLAHSLESTAVDFLQVSHISKHLVAQGTPDAGPGSKGGGVLCPVGSDEGVDASISQGQ